MRQLLEFLDAHQERLLSIAETTVEDFRKGNSFQVTPERLLELGDLVSTFWAAQGQLNGTPQQPDAGYYSLSVAPDLLQRLEGNTSTFTELADGYIAQVREAESGRILGVSLLTQLVPHALKTAARGGPQAFAAAAGFSLVVNTLDSINVLHDKLDNIQSGIDNLVANLEAQDNSVVSIAVKVAQRSQDELTDAGLTETDRREIKRRLEDNWDSVGQVMHKAKDLLQPLVKSKQKRDKPAKASSITAKLPKPSLKIRIGTIEDATLPLFYRLVSGLIAKTHLLTTLELTDLGKGVRQREQELRADLEEVRNMHRNFRREWAQSESTIQQYAVNVNAQFELAEELQKLAHELERLRWRSNHPRKFVLEVDSNRQVTRVAALPAS